MTGASDYAVVYDITSDSERRRIDRLLKGFGFRIQKSVFECRLNKRGREVLLEKLRLFDIKSGFVKLYRLEYNSGGDSIGAKKRETIDDGPAFII